MKSRNFTVFLLVLFLLLSVGLSYVLISINNIDKLTEENTTEYTATVYKTELTDTEKRNSVKIFTIEHTTYLLISPIIVEDINIEDIYNLQSGDKIYFRVENYKKRQIDKVAFIDIVSLKTQDKILYSLTNYNEYAAYSAKYPRIIGIICVALFAFLFLFYFIKLKHQVNQIRERNQSGDGSLIVN